MNQDDLQSASETRGASQTLGQHVLSVIVPVHQGGEELPKILAALAQSDLPRSSWELIIVDDASTDDSAAIAAAHADLVIRLTGRPRGPAYARNRGFEASRGSVVAFVDADVLVHPQALSRMLDAIGEDPTIGAVIGVYDDGRTSGRLVSEYRNLVRHFEHESTTGETDAFTSGLALVRRDAFIAAGMFDEWRFPRPQVEALELGDRLHSLGYRILRRPDAEATHLKRWTLRSWIQVDLLDRGMSAARLSQFPNLKVRADRLYVTTRLDALLAWVTLTSLAVGVWQQSVPFVLLGLSALLALVVHNVRLFASFMRARSLFFAVAAVPLHLFACAAYSVASALGRLLYHAIGETQPDPVVQAFAEVGARTWPPIPSQRFARPEGAHSHTDHAGRQQ